MATTKIVPGQSTGLAASGNNTDITSLKGITGQVEFSKGADIASTGNLVLGTDGNVFRITGTNQINLISSTGWQAGSTVQLIFASTCVIKNAQTTNGVYKSINLFGSGDYTSSVGAILELTYDGTSWYDVDYGMGVAPSSIIATVNDTQSRVDQLELNFGALLTGLFTDASDNVDEYRENPDAITEIAAASLASVAPTTNQKVASISAVFDGGGSALIVGTKVDIRSPFSGVITAATMLADQSGSVAVEVRKCTYAQYDSGVTHPVTGDKISASSPPTITSTTKSSDAVLAGWITSISIGDIIEFYISSATTIQRVSICLDVMKN